MHVDRVIENLDLVLLHSTITEFSRDGRKVLVEVGADSALSFGVMSTKWSDSSSRSCWFLTRGFIPTRHTGKETCRRE